MAKRYRTLQKKLEEIESQLYQAFLLAPQSDDAEHQRLAAEIEQRFLFVKKLLAAEVSSSTKNPSNRRHLRHLAKTIEILEVGFSEWKDHSEINHAGGASNSACSCDDGSGREDDASNVQDSLDFEEALVDVDVKLEPEKAAYRGGGGTAVAVSKEKGGKIGSYFSGLMTGTVFGMILMGWVMGLELDDIRLLPPYSTVHHAYLIPT